MLCFPVPQTHIETFEFTFVEEQPLPGPTEAAILASVSFSTLIIGLVVNIRIFVMLLSRDRCYNFVNIF
jgi:hypothetical protein